MLDAAPSGIEPAGGPSRDLTPFSASHFALLDPFLDARLLLAVSGGPDSTALMHLAAEWAGARGQPAPAVATVDHGLRPEARDEAEGVVEAARRLGLPAAVLTWTGDKPRTGIAAQARSVRYRLLFAQAEAIGATHVVTAHTRDDQAETVIMRLARGSGLSGLSAMRATTQSGDLILARPLLGVAKAELVATCRAAGWPFVEDPSNDNPASTRVCWRRLAPALAREGLTADRLVRFAARAARADDALARIAAAARRHAALPPDDAGLRLRFDALSGHPEEIQLRVIGSVVAEAGGGTAPRLDRLESLVAALQSAFAAKAPLRRTLGGCIVALDGTGTLSITPEPPRRRGRNGDASATPIVAAKASPFTLTRRSLGKATRASYIPTCDTTARYADAVETHCTSPGDGQVVLLSAGRQ